MSGRRLLDAAALFKASRGVASKHLSLRSHQLDTYSRTSSLAKVVKSQADRVTLTVRAAAALNQRFNGPDYSTQTQRPHGPKSEVQVPGERNVDGESKLGVKQGLEQDHFYKRSEANTVAQPVPKRNLGVHQEEAKARPLPDGSIPPAESDALRSTRDEDVFSRPQRTSPTKDPLPESRPEELRPQSSVASTIPKPARETSQLPADRARQLQRQYEDQIPSQSAEPPPARQSNQDTELSERAVDQEKDIYYTPPSNISPVLSALPRVKVPKVTADAQESDEHVPDGEINQDVFYSSRATITDHALPASQAVPEQETPSEDMYSDIFHSSRVAKMLGGGRRQNENPKGLELPGANDTPIEQTKRAEFKDQETFNSRSSTEEASEATQANDNPALPEASVQHADEDIHKLAADMAEDAQSSVSQTTEVCSILLYLGISILIG